MIDEWILSTGEWNDGGIWIDEALWRDLPVIKPNIQKFRKNDEYSDRMFYVVNDVNSLQQLYLWLYNDTFIVSPFFGAFVYDNELFDLAAFFSREYWVDNFPAILSAVQRAGTFDSYYQVIVSALGSNTEVVFDAPNPSHLIINITAPTGNAGFGAWHQEQLVGIIPEQIPNPDQGLAFARSLAPLTVNETIKMIDLLNVNGVFVEVNIT
jgi:hypothetical protein